MNLQQYYQEIYAEQMALPPDERRFMFFQPTDHTGWGNQLRGLTLGILLSLATRRILVLKDFLIEEHFLPPDGCQWTYSYWRHNLKELGAKASTIQMHLSPDNWDEGEWTSYANERMDSLFPAQVLVLTEGVGFSDQLMANRHYLDLWRSIGLDVTSKISWMGTLCQAFLSRPTEKLSRRHQNLNTRLGLNPGDRFGVVQFRTFFDIGSPRKALVETFLRETQRVLAEDGWSKIPLLIATDDAQVTRELAQGLNATSPTMVSPTKVIHTGYMHSGWLRLTERILRKALGRDVWIGDVWAWLPAHLRPRPHTDILAEWILYGEASFAISSFTSYAAFAMARTGNTAALYRFDAETKTVSGLVNSRYFF